MHITRKSRRNIALFLLAFLGIPVLRLIQNYFSILFLYSNAEFISAILIILWMRSIQVRILDKNVREQLLKVCHFLILYFVLLMAKYTWTNPANDLAIRLIWDFYYIPMAVIPSRIFLVALCIGQENTDQVVKKLKIIKILETLLCLLILTNQWHQLLVTNKNAVSGGPDGTVKGIVYWIYLGWTVFFFLAAFITMIKRCKLADRLRHIWLPMLPIVNGIVYFALYNLGMDLKIMIRGYSLRWMNLGQMFAFMVVGFLEGCIQIGVIGSNSGYDTLFRNMSGKAKILDDDGHVIFETNDKWPEDLTDSQIEEDLKIVETPVTGGTFYYATDLRKLHALNLEISKTTESIEQRYDYLKTEQELLVERSAIRERNRLYDSIREMILPQLTKTKELLDKGDDSSLAKAAVLTAYIKRRSNMEMLAHDNDYADVQELELALKESAGYLTLCGIKTMVVCRSRPDDRQTAKLRDLITIYERFQAWVEHNLEHTCSLQILMYSSGQGLELQLRQDGELVVTFERGGGL